MATEERNQEIYQELINLVSEYTGHPVEEIKHLAVVMANEKGYDVIGCEHAHMIIGLVADQDAVIEISRELARNTAANNN